MALRTIKLVPMSHPQFERYSEQVMTTTLLRLFVRMLSYRKTHLKNTGRETFDTKFSTLK